ncbi:SDR family oxidoreductase [Nonomuraea sp. KC401]|uniref:SDR family oxidoreductase n=1 Tax=unclassified Nonomuraea TaxID=2593643 RepID=UPI0010FD0024|nr:MULTISPECIES: SDR family oxidoreductase [unclassified Nonomuraea]NBE93326.1 SDR family NAD(P)-dependent oxidoreductase [Nonomuraea sp. K271]TLF73485.1 SDR family oxidoreductase [Nonomuraea sp. KC401]
MRVQDKVVVVTGAAGGIGRAMARRFAAEGAAGVVVADLDAAGASAVAAEIGHRAAAVRVDVSSEEEVAALVETPFGPVDLFCSNAGVIDGHGLDASVQDWNRLYAVNVLAHVHAARAAVPSMIARGGGYLLNTCSAAGLISCPGDAPYAVTKAAAIAFAEWLAIHYAPKGIKVSVLCPQGVRTAMLEQGLEDDHLTARAVSASGPVLDPADVAGTVIDGLAAERFHIFPHPEVAEYVRRKAEDPDRWLAGMSRFVTSLTT